MPSCPSSNDSDRKVKKWPASEWHVGREILKGILQPGIFPKDENDVESSDVDNGKDGEITVTDLETNTKVHLVDSKMIPIPPPRVPL